MAQMAKKLPHGQRLLCAKGSHWPMLDDQPTYFVGLAKFFEGVEARWPAAGPGACRPCAGFGAGAR